MCKKIKLHKTDLFCKQQIQVSVLLFMLILNDSACDAARSCRLSLRPRFVMTAAPPAVHKTFDWTSSTIKRYQAVGSTRSCRLVQNSWTTSIKTQLHTAAPSYSPALQFIQCYSPHVTRHTTAAPRPGSLSRVPRSTSTGARFVSKVLRTRSLLHRARRVWRPRTWWRPETRQPFCWHLVTRRAMLPSDPSPWQTRTDCRLPLR